MPNHTKIAALVALLTSFLSARLGFLGRTAKFYSGLICYVFLLAVAASYGVIISIILSFIGKRGLAQHSVARFFYMIARPVLNISVEVRNQEGLDSIRPAVFISNHQTELDILILAKTFPKWCSVTAKEALKHYPFLGWFMQLSGSVFVDRAHRDNALKTFASACEKMKNDKQSVFLFPEGTRSYSNMPMFLPFKKGAFHLAVQSQLPIVPYVSGNYSDIFNFKSKNFNSGKIIIKVLEPIETKGKTKDDVNDLLKLTRSRMLKAIIEIYKEEHPDFKPKLNDDDLLLLHDLEESTTPTSLDKENVVGNISEVIKTQSESVTI